VTGLLVSADITRLSRQTIAEAQRIQWRLKSMLGSQNENAYSAEVRRQ
jgi:hypothetical protein